MATVHFQHVSKTFRGRNASVCAVDDLNLAIEDQGLLVLVGPSGCGKTTTLLLLAGLEQPDAGTIRIGDRDVTHVPPRNRDVAMVFQNHALYPHMTVAGNLSFGLRMRCVGKEEMGRRVGRVSRLLAINDLLSRRPADLSGGEQQRVALGRALVRHPSVFLLDEPLSNLDATLRLRLRTEIKRLQREIGVTMIYVTHDQEEAMTLADRIVLLKEGVVQQCGPPLTLYDVPCNRFVASFFGTPPMNILEGHLEFERGVLFFRCSLGRLTLPAELAAQIAVAPRLAPISLGIRPEYIRLDDCGVGADGADAGRTVRVAPLPVRATERLGSATRLHLCVPGGGHLVVSVPSSARVSVGERVAVRFDRSRIVLFSGAGGRVRSR